jgi:hypothetical protein
VHPGRDQGRARDVELEVGLEGQAIEDLAQQVAGAGGRVVERVGLLGEHPEQLLDLARVQAAAQQQRAQVGDGIGRLARSRAVEEALELVLRQTQHAAPARALAVEVGAQRLEQLRVAEDRRRGRGAVDRVPHRKDPAGDHVAGREQLRGLGLEDRVLARAGQVAQPEALAGLDAGDLEDAGEGADPGRRFGRAQAARRRLLVLREHLDRHAAEARALALEREPLQVPARREPSGGVRGRPGPEELACAGGELALQLRILEQPAPQGGEAALDAGGCIFRGHWVRARQFPSVAGRSCAPP